MSSNSSQDSGAPPCLRACSQRGLGRGVGACGTVLITHPDLPDEDLREVLELAVDPVQRGGVAGVDTVDVVVVIAADPDSEMARVRRLLPTITGTDGSALVVEHGLARDARQARRDRTCAKRRDLADWATDWAQKHRAHVDTEPEHTLDAEQRSAADWATTSAVCLLTWRDVVRNGAPQDDDTPDDMIAFLHVLKQETRINQGRPEVTIMPMPAPLAERMGVWHHGHEHEGPHGGDARADGTGSSTETGAAAEPDPMPPSPPPARGPGGSM